MPSTPVTIVVPQAFDFVDVNAAKLAARKTVTPGATTTDGVRVESMTSVSPTSTAVNCTVLS